MERRTLESAVSAPASDSTTLLNFGSQTALIDLLPMAAYAVLAPDGVIAWFNSRAAELWGHVPTVGDTDERFCGAHKLFHPDGASMAYGNTPVARAMSTGVALHDEEVVIERPDRSRVTVSVHVDPIRNPDGTIAGAVNFFHDITDRKHAEQATGLLAAIVDSSDDAIVSKNLDGVITSWNQGAERMFGYSASEAVGQNILLIVPSDRRHEEPEILERLKRGERVDHFETIRVAKDGTMLDISLTISPVRDITGRVVGASKVARDITKRKHVEQALAERALLLDLSNDAILVRDGEDRVTYWNKSASDLYGFSRDEAIGRVSHELLQTEFPEPLERVVEQLYRHNRWSGELVHKRKDGRQIVVGSRWALGRNDRGDRKCVLETNNDITQQKRSEKALRESEDRLRALADGLETQVRVRTEELEIRNSEILQQSEQLRELSTRLQQIQDEERRHIARELHDSAGQIVTALTMNLAKITQHVRQNPLLADAIQESQDMVHQLSREIRTMSYLLHPPLLDETGLTDALGWYVQGVAELSRLKIDLDIAEGLDRFPREIELAIFRVIQECLTNIIRHSGSKTATIRLSRAVESVSLEIRDQGQGISAEKLLAIQSQRAGVGVTGMRERVRHLGGMLNIQSNAGGTEVCVQIPVPADDGSKPRSGSQLGRNSIPGRTAD
jgi:PAS domain S-box-containing protein